jgi:hypothetical protein
MPEARPSAVTDRKRGNGGEEGIRTLGTAFRPYNGLANRRLQPLGHLTADVQVYEIQALTRSAHDAGNDSETGALVAQVPGHEFFAALRAVVSEPPAAGTLPGTLRSISTAPARISEE